MRQTDKDKYHNLTEAEVLGRGEYQYACKIHKKLKKLIRSIRNDMDCRSPGNRPLYGSEELY